MAARPAIELHLAQSRQAPLYPPDIAFLVSFGFSPDDLAAARDRAARIGEPAHRVLIASGRIDEAAYTRLLAQRIGAGIARDNLTPDPRVTLQDAVRQGWMRAREADGQEVLVLNASGPIVLAVLETPTLHRRAGLTIAGEAAFRSLLLRHFGGAIALQAATTVPEREPYKDSVFHY